MGLQEAFIVTAGLVLVTCTPGIVASNMQAELDMGGNSELLQMIFKQIEMLGKRDEDEKTSLSMSHTELAAALLQVAPVITIRGNITDSARRLTVTFTVQASQDRHLPQSAEAEADDDDKDDWDYNWRGSGGVFTPIVGVVEPYVLGLVELVFNGILSSVISNFLEGTSMLGDVRLV